MVADVVQVIPKDSPWHRRVSTTACQTSAETKGEGRTLPPAPLIRLKNAGAGLRWDLSGPPRALFSII